MSAPSCTGRYQRGFSLLELVAVIVLLGVTAVATSQFIGQGMGIYVDTVRRDSLQQQGRFAIERLSRELRNALPGSVRVQGYCIEFVPIEAASSYLGNVADFAQTGFQAVDFDYTSSAVSGRSVAVYTVANEDVYSIGRGAVAELLSVAAVDSSQRRVKLAEDSDPGHRFWRESPTGRFYIVTAPVSFCLSANQLLRHSDYGWLAVQSSSSGDLGSGQLLAESIVSLDAAGDPIAVFAFNSGTLQRAGAVHLDFRFRDSAAEDEQLVFSQEILLRNTP